MKRTPDWLIGLTGNLRLPQSNRILTLAACTALITAHALLAQNAYITDNGNSSITVINTATNTITATVPVASHPFGVAVSPDGSRVYVAYRDQANKFITVIDTATNTVTASVPGVGVVQQGIAVSPDGSQLYVTNAASNSVSVINTVTNTVTATIPVGSEPTAVAVSPDGSQLYVTNFGPGSNSVSVINTASNTVTATLPIAKPFGIAVSPDGSQVYVTNAVGDSVSVINTASNTVTATIPVGTDPFYVAVSPDGSQVYVTNAGGGSVSVINTASNTVTATIPVGGEPVGIAVTSDGSRVYVANAVSHSVLEINTATNTVTTTVPLPVGTTPAAFGKFIQPTTPFSSFSAKLNVAPGLFGSFNLNATFVLAASRAINPVTQPVTLSIGPPSSSYGVTIPVGSFHQLQNGSKSGGWVFSGNIGGVNLSIQIDPLGSNAYQFKATGSPVNFTGATSPTTVTISINGNQGTVRAKF